MCGRNDRGTRARPGRIGRRLVLSEGNCYAMNQGGDGFVFAPARSSKGSRPTHWRKTQTRPSPSRTARSLHPHRQASLVHRLGKLSPAGDRLHSSRNNDAPMNPSVCPDRAASRSSSRSSHRSGWSFDRPDWQIRSVVPSGCVTYRNGHARKRDLGCRPGKPFRLSRSVAGHGQENGEEGGGRQPIPRLISAVKSRRRVSPAESSRWRRAPPPKATHR